MTRTTAIQTATETKNLGDRIVGLLEARIAAAQSEWFAKHGAVPSYGTVGMAVTEIAAALGVDYERVNGALGHLHKAGVTFGMAHQTGSRHVGDWLIGLRGHLG
jgi:hypothetical protein